jgi:hypothetical protein
LRIGGVDLVLHPAAGGRTEDELLVVMRENVIARLHRARTGYLQPDVGGLRPHTRQEWHAARTAITASGRRFRQPAQT